VARQPNERSANFSKTDVRYWQDAIFKPTYKRNGQTVEVEDWSVRVQWRGRRETFNLKTPNKATAAAKAKEIYMLLVGAGWDAAFEKFKPEMARKSVSTVAIFSRSCVAIGRASRKRSRIIAGAFGKSSLRFLRSKPDQRNSIMSTVGERHGLLGLIASSW